MENNLYNPENINTEIIREQVITRYGFSENLKIQLLKFSENLTYRLDDDKPYILRLNKPGYHDYQELEDELKWIDALKEDSPLNIAGSVKGANGKRIQSIEFPEIDLACFCSVTEFIPGHTLSGMKGKKLDFYMGELGRISAHLHNHVSSWDEAIGIKRFSWDFESLAGKNARWGHFSLHKGLTDEQVNTFTEALEIIEKRLMDYGKHNKNYGLIHSDLNINNILVDSETIYVLDFDDCGFGWFLYDLSTCVLEYFEDTEECNLFDLVDTWLDGYTSVRKLSVEDLAELDTFILLRKIVRIGWIATHIDNDTVKKVDSEYYNKVLAMAKAYCNKHK